MIAPQAPAAAPAQAPARRTRILARYREAWEVARSLREALRFLAEYAAIRLWSIVILCFPVELNLQTARLMGRLWWWLMPRHRQRALEHLRFALGDRYDEGRLHAIARRSFEHFAQLFLVEFVMTPRLITPWSWARYVELGELREALRMLLERRGTIFVTAHFGNFELLGYVIARLGLPLHAVMRPLDNPLLTRMLVETRRSGGLSLLFKKGAASAFQTILHDGGALCFIGDQDAGRKGIFAPFFGRPASWYKSIGLLAMSQHAPIVVGCATRIGQGFHYRIDVERILVPEQWECQADPLRWITQEVAQAMERFVRRAPEQYLWVHRRWKTPPRDEPASRAGG
jgi:KDO2-lipid IV(A) lauroyltransferase